MEEINSRNLEVKGGPSRLVNFGNSFSDQSSEISDNVFSNPMLIDKIVKYSMYQPNGETFDRQTFAAVRLVNSNWLQSTSRVLKKLEKSLVYIRVGLKHPDYGLNCQEFEKENILQNFTSTFSKHCRSSEPIFTVALLLGPQCFLEENKVLTTFLEEFSQNIISLNVIYPITSATINLGWSHIQFNSLRNFFLLCKKEQGRADFKNCLNFVQEIFRNSSKLNTFIMINSLETSGDISSLRFPPSIETISLGWDLTNHDLTLVRSKNLPNLKILELDVYKQSQADIVFKLLQHIGQQLTSLTLRVPDKITELLASIRIPLMEKLTKFDIFGRYFELAPELQRVWPTLMPNLTCIVLEDTEEYLFFDLFQGSKFENVEKFDLSLNVSPNEQVLKEVLTSFPKIQELSLRFTKNRVSGLKFLFRNFTHLKKLCLNFYIDVVDDSLDHKLVSCILGVPLELSKAIVDNNEENQVVPTDNPKSIMNLKGLSSITLATSIFDSSGSPVTLRCSKIIFTHGLQRMPSLKEIKMQNGFRGGSELN